MDPALLDLFVSLLGEDHPAVQAIATADPNPDAVYDGASDEELAAIAAFANVSDDDLTALVDALRDLGRAEDTPTDDVIAAADLVQGLRYVQDVRTEAAQIEEEARQAALAALGDDPDDEPDEDDTEPVAETDDVTEETPETVAASRPRIGQVAPRVARPSRPVPTVEGQEQAISAAALRLVDSIGGEFERGQIATFDDVVLALARKWETTAGTEGVQRHTVASAKWLDQYPEEQRLAHGDVVGNDARIQAAVGNYRNETPEALTAAICAPPTPIYDIPTIGTEARPVKDFLPSFGATRGGIVYRRGYSLTGAGTVNNNTSGVTAGWSDGDSNKVVLSVPCPETVTTQVEAFVARAEVSNMQGQFDPESVAAALRRQMVFWARQAETSLLDTINTNSSKILGDNAAVVGFGRLLLERWNNAATLIRSQERMAYDATLDLLLPSWVVNAFQDDIAFQAPGDGLVSLEQVAADIERYLAARNIRVGWFLDQQLMPTQSFTAPADLAGYPQQVTGYIFEPGAHLFLDGGELNLGIVRDSTLNNTNEYQTFMETFEAVAFRGVVSWAIQHNVCRSGTSGAPAEITCGEIS